MTTTDKLADALQSHAQQLRKAAKEIRDEGHAGWGNACEFAADAIDAAIKARDAAVPVALRELVEVCETEFCSAATDKDEPDDSKVAFPEDQCAITFGHIRRARSALTAPPAQPVSMPDGWVLVPVELLMPMVPDIKDMLADEFGIYDCAARPLWAALLKIVAGVGISDLLTTTQEKDHER